VKLQTIVCTTDMESAVGWYSAVLGSGPVYRSDVWTSFAAGDAYFALHRVEALPEESRVELSLVAGERLEKIIDRLGAVNLPVERGIQEETFGRSFLLRDPEGLVIQVNEHEHDD